MHVKASQAAAIRLIATTMNLARFVLAVSLLTASVCKAQNFDCAKASTLAEKTICDSSELSEQDLILSKIYRLVSKTAINPSAFKTEQRRWIAKRNACKSSEDCLERSYKVRIGELEKAWIQQASDLDRAPKLPHSSKPFEGNWSSCFLWKGDEICTGYRLVQSGKQICGEWDYWATNRTYSGQLQAVARDSNQADVKLICGTSGSETSTECQDDPEQRSGWESAKGGLSVCRNHLSTGTDKPCNDKTYLQSEYRYSPLTKEESMGFRSESWVKNCLAGRLPHR